jgi:cysteine-S-conjugate beta-lyase
MSSADSFEDRFGRPPRTATQLAHLGRQPDDQHGFVNTPIYRGSTVLFPTLDALTAYNQEYTYGRRGTPTVRRLEEALTELEGGARTVITPSGYSAITTALLAFAEAGDHILVSDSVYQPTRKFCDDALSHFGVIIEYYDPLMGAEIARLFRPNTRLVMTESPGSQTMEVQDIPAIAGAAREHGLWVLNDNTWATPLYFQPLAHGVDVSIQSGTKYLTGHSDTMLGAITANARAASRIVRMHGTLGLCGGPEDCFLALRGLRSLGVRLERHWKSGLEMAEWLAARPEVTQVLHPALPGAPGHELWRRDFTGASGLFSVILKPVKRKALAAMLDGLTLFGMGFSWGGFESLVIPFDPSDYRTATKPKIEGQALRLHIGVEDTEDLKADLAAGFERLNAAG